MHVLSHRRVQAWRRAVNRSSQVRAEEVSATTRAARRVSVRPTITKSEEWIVRARFMNAQGSSVKWISPALVRSAGFALGYIVMSLSCGYNNVEACRVVSAAGVLGLIN